MRLCPHRLASAEQWVKQYDAVKQGDREIAVVIALLRSILCFRDACSEHLCLAQIEALSEGEYMDYVLEQLRTGQSQAYSTFTDADLEAVEEEHVGEEFARYPFLY